MFSGNIFDNPDEEDSLDELLLRHEEERNIFWNNLKKEVMDYLDDEEDTL